MSVDVSNNRLMNNRTSIEEYLSRPCAEKCCKCTPCLNGPFQFDRWINGCGECGKTHAEVDLSNYTPTIGSTTSYQQNGVTITKEIFEVVEIIPKICISDSTRKYIGEYKVKFTRESSPIDQCSFLPNEYFGCYQLFINASSNGGLSITAEIVNESISAGDFFASFEFADLPIPEPTEDCESVTVDVSDDANSSDEGTIVFKPSCCGECDFVSDNNNCPNSSDNFGRCGSCRTNSFEVSLSFTGVEHCEPFIEEEGFDESGPVTITITNEINIPDNICIDRNGVITLNNAITQTVTINGQTTTNNFNAILNVTYALGIGVIEIRQSGNGPIIFRHYFCVCCKDLIDGASQTGSNQVMCDTDFCNINFPNLPKAIASGGSVTVTACCTSNLVSRTRVRLPIA